MRTTRSRAPEDAAAGVGKSGWVGVRASHLGRGSGWKMVRCAVEERRDGGGRARPGARAHALSLYGGVGVWLLPEAEYLEAGGASHREMERVL